MGGDIQEEAVLAAVKPLKNANSTPAAGDFDTPRTDSTGNSESFGSVSLEQLFTQHHARVFRTAYRVTGSTADAEDVLQTVFLRLARGSEAAGALENPEGYFSRAAINASLDLLRSRKRARAVAIDDVEGGTPFVTRQNPETGHADRELRELIRTAVSRLGPTAGQMFAMRYFEGHSNNEIASLMNTSPLVVGVTLHRARARLRKEIGKYLRSG